MPTSAARANTISRSAPGAPRRCASIWCHAAFRASACGPSPTARSGRSRCATTSPAGRKIGAPLPCSTRVRKLGAYRMRPLHRRPRGRRSRFSGTSFPWAAEPLIQTSHNLVAGRAMLRQRRSPKTSHTMIRSASLLVMTGALWAGAAHAQTSSADLVTRIDHLQAQVRELTGTVEELQYRNQQLEQEVQRLRAAAPGVAAATASTAQSSPPAGPRYSSPQYPPPAGAYPPPAGAYPPPAGGYPAPAPQSTAAVASAPVAAPPPPTSSDANLSGLRHSDAF